MDDKTPLKTTGSVLINDKGEVLPYTCQSYASQVREWCDKHSIGWEQLKSMGCRIAHCEITVVKILDNDQVP